MPSEFDYSGLDFTTHTVGGAPEPAPDSRPRPILPSPPPAPKPRENQPPKHAGPTAEEAEEYLEDQDDEELSDHKNIMASVMEGESSFAIGYRGKATDHVRDGGDAFTHQDLFAGVAKKRKLVKTLKWTSGFAVLFAILAGSFLFLGRAAPEASRAATLNDPLGSFSVIHTNAMQGLADEVTPVNLAEESLVQGKLATSTGKEFLLAPNTDAVVQVAPACGDLSFCLAGNYTPNDATGAPGDTHDVYYTQDIIGAPVLKEASEFYRANLTANAKKNYTAGAVTTVMFEGKPSRFLALINEDGSGWLVRLYPDDKPQEIVNKF